MSVKYYSVVLFCLLIASNYTFAQTSIKLPSGLGLSNQLEYSYDTEKKLEIFENWLNVDYRKGIFSAGFRFDVFQPNDPNPAVSRGKDKYAEISYKYITAKIGNKREGAEITVGNFYSLFGRGLILKSYEDRAIRIDNNLLGVKIEGRYAKFKLTALTGMSENMQAERKDILHAVDLEYSGIRKFKLGGSFASNLPDAEAARTRFASVRVQPSIWNFDLYGEYGIKQNDDIRDNIFNGNEKIAGKAFYGNLNFYLGSLSFSGEYKLYDNYSFNSHDGTIFYNTPPALRKDYTYILLNRHPSILNADNERGVLLETIYTLSNDTYFTASYGITKSLDSTSFYQRIRREQVSANSFIPVRTLYKEVYATAQHAWNKGITTIAAFGYREELASDTKNITPILENRFYIDETNTIKLILEHQLTTNRATSEQFYNTVVFIEWLRSPKLSLTLVGEMETREPEKGRLVRKIWSFIQVGYKIGQHTDISLLAGTRQAGNICIGGVCRYEPEFRGVELKMQTRLF